MPPPRHISASVLSLSAAAALGGCRTAFEAHRDELRHAAAHGDYGYAAAVLEEPETERLYGDKNRLLYLLDRGSVALAMEDHDTTLALLERAEAMMEVYRETAGDEIARWLINDTAAPYRGEPYEDIYVNVLKLLAQLEAGRIEGGATVEARRLATKADVLRDRYLAYTSRVKEEADPALRGRLGGGGGGGGLVTHNEEGRFVESTLGTYLTAVTFMEAGDRSNQGVAARRLVDSIRLQSQIVGPADPEDFLDLGERRSDESNVLVVALSGAAPYKVAQRFGPILLFDVPLYFELPVLVPGEQHAAGARVIVAPATPPETRAQALEGLGDESIAEFATQAIPAHSSSAQPVEIPGETWLSYELSFVEDMSSVAQENHEREMPFIYARTLIRASAKALGSFAATQAVRSSTDDDDLAVIASVIGGLLFVGLTEKADLRSWIFLPGRADVGLLDLPPGRHRVRVEYLAPGGGVIYASPWQEIEAPDRGLVTIVEHYWQ